MANNKFSVILGNLGNTCDRFLSSGYKDIPPKDELIKQAASIEGVCGIELVGTWDINASNVQEMKTALQNSNLQLSSIIPDHFGQKKWGRGALAAKDSAIRAEAIAESSGKDNDNNEDHEQYCTMCGPDFCSMRISKEL